MKALVERCKECEENLGEAIAAWRNMARNDGTTPAELFYGRKLRQTLPMLPITEWTDQDVSARDATHTRQAELRDRNTAEFKQLKPGQRVLVQHHISKDWTIKATITAIRQDGYSYVVQTDEGKSFIRGRRLLKCISNDNNIDKCNNPQHTTTTDRAIDHPQRHQQPVPQELPSQPPQKMPRRSARINKREQHQANRCLLYTSPSPRDS